MRHLVIGWMAVLLLEKVFEFALDQSFGLPVRDWLVCLLQSAARPGQSVRHLVSRQITVARDTLDSHMCVLC